MEGVRILLAVDWPTPILILWVALAAFAAWLTYHFFMEEENNILGVLSILALAFLVWCCIWDVTTPKETRYDVIIEDGYNYSDFAKKYEVLKTSGEMLTITVKNHE